MLLCVGLHIIEVHDNIAALLSKMSGLLFGSFDIRFPFAGLVTISLARFV
jgi:hypothetical protein